MKKKTSIAYKYQLVIGAHCKEISCRTRNEKQTIYNYKLERHTNSLILGQSITMSIAPTFIVFHPAKHLHEDILIENRNDG